MDEGAQKEGSSPVLVIALDASEITLIDRLCAAGEMPNLQALRRRGARARLIHKHGGLQASVWRSFATGQEVTRHGCYFPKMWRPEKMRVDFIDRDWPPSAPFWSRPGVSQPRVALIDIPYLVDIGTRHNGVVLNNWQNHDPLPEVEHPKTIKAQVRNRFGNSALPEQDYGPQSAEILERAYRTCLASTSQIADICEWLMTRDRYDLFVLAMGATHRAGHQLWDLSQIDAASLDDARRSSLENALADVYRASDHALGRIIAAAPDNARIVVMALHGMGPQTAWNEFFQPVFELAAGMPARESDSNTALGLLKRVKDFPLVKSITVHAPPRLHPGLTRFWTRRMYDWPTTQYFWVPSDVEGYVRLNLRGREPEGVVERGTEARALLEELADGFRELRDLDTGQPIVEHVEFIDDLPTPVSPLRDCIPDLIIHWTDFPQRQSRGLRNRHGHERHWKKGRRHLSGRSGNHRPDGWAVMISDDMPKGVDLGAVPAINLAPTISTWLGLGVSDSFDGEPLQRQLELA
ncbi:MAG: alkaline phosphatase family protein [Pseudomonadota bacterium]